MSYQLKTTGIAANLLMSIAVDPDTDAVKDFCSASITSTLTLQSGVTVSSQMWNGISRKFVQTTSANCIAFGAGKPLLEFNSTTATARTVVFIGESAGGGGRIFGDSTASVRFGETNPSSGGATHPFFESNAIASGNISAPSSGSKCIYGHSLTYGGEVKWYTATDVAASMTSGVANAAFSPSGLSKSLGYVGRFDYSGTMAAVKIHAVLIFNIALSEAQWDSLRSDWFGTLFESAGGTDATGTGTPASITLTAPAGSAAGTSDATDGTGSGTLQSILLTAPAGTATGTSAGSGTITTPVMKNNTGAVLANETGVIVNVYNASTGVLIVQKTGQTSNASGIVTISDALIVPATTYAYEVVLTGSRRRLPVVSAV